MEKFENFSKCRTYSIIFYIEFFLSFFSILGNFTSFSWHKLVLNTFSKNILSVAKCQLKCTRFSRHKLVLNTFSKKFFLAPLRSARSRSASLRSGGLASVLSGGSNSPETRAARSPLPSSISQLFIAYRPSQL